MKFKKNVGKKDKIIRLIIGVPLVIWSIYLRSWWIIFGIIIVVTALIEHCTVYTWLGFDTIGKKKN